MAMYYTLGLNDGTPIEDAPKWSGRDWMREGFRDEAAAAAREVDPSLGDVHVVLLQTTIASGRLK